MEKIREKSSVIYVSVITSFITTFMGSALNLSVPALEKEFHVSAGTVSWVITIYMLTCASFAVPFGRLGDRVERRRILYMGILIFSISSAAAVFSAGIGFFLAARIMQGIGASMIFSTNIAILVGAFDEDMRGKVLGYSTCATYVGLSAGPVAGGILNYNFGWRSVFIATAIVSAVAFCVAFFRLPYSKKTEFERKPADLAGNILFVISVILLMYGISSLRQGRVSLFILGSGIASFIVFIYRESKARNPLVDLKIFRDNPSFLLLNLAAMINYGANFVMSYMLSVYLQIIKGMTSQLAGVILVTNTAVMAVLSPYMGKLSDRLSPSKLSALGMSLCAASLFIFSGLTQDTSTAKIIFTLALSGAGLALFSAPNTNAVMSCVKKEDYGVASSILSTMRSMGHSSAMALATAIIGLYMGTESMTSAQPDSIMTTVHVIFSLFAALCILGIFMAIRRKM
ncbi:MAG: MFS transporter [Anaerovoracaceae bacterium]|mgnify:FL=1|nr:MFS transporter [Bacillota bacterium]